MFAFADYLTNINEIGGFYSAKNASAPTAQDGTEYVAQLINDMFFGPIQILMTYAGLTPNGVTETVSANQYLTALQRSAIAPGTLMPYLKVGDPATNGDRMLLLTGQRITIAGYPLLVAAVYVGDSANATAATFYKCDSNGTRNTAGTHFQLFDARGRVPRGNDPSATLDPDGATRTIGSLQLDQMQGHFHNSPIPNAAYAIIVGSGGGSALSGGSNVSGLIDRTGEPTTDGVNGTPRTGIETRMVNFQVKWGITY